MQYIGRMVMVKKELVYGRNIGAIVGAIIFLVYGLVPGFHFGKYGTEVTLHHLFGEHYENFILAVPMSIVGIMLGIFCIGAVLIVLGSVFGTFGGYIVAISAGPNPKHAHHN